MLLLELQQDEVCRKSKTEWGLRIKKWPIPGLLTVPQEQVFLMTMMMRIVLLRGAFFWSRRYGNVYNRAVIRNRVKVPCQTLFQTIFLIPTILISFTDAGGSIIWTDLFNWRIASILISFGTFALTFYNIRWIFSDFNPLKWFSFQE